MILKDSDHNVGGNLYPLNNVCTLGQVSHSICHGCVFNTVYNVGNNAVFGCLDKALNLCDERLFINSLGQGVLVSENQRTVLGAFCAYKNQICRSLGEVANAALEHHVGVQRRACGNSDNDLVNISVSTRYCVAVLIGVRNGVSGVAGNNDDNVGIGHDELAVINLDLGSSLSTVNGLVNIENCGVTNSVAGNGDDFTFDCRALIYGYVAVNKDFVRRLLILDSLEYKRIASRECRFDQFFNSVLRQSLTALVYPNVAKVFAVVIFNALLDSVKDGVLPLGNGVVKRIYQLIAVFEFYADNGFNRIDPEQIEVAIKESFCGGSCAIPLVVVVIAARTGQQAVYFRRRKDGIGNGVTVFTANEVINVVGDGLKNTGNSYRLCRHYKVAVERFAVEHQLVVFQTLGQIADLVCGCNCVAGCIEAVDVNALTIGVLEVVYKRTLYCRELIFIDAVYCILGILKEQAVLVEELNGGEVRSVELNGACSGFKINLFAINCYKGLNIVLILYSEGQEDFNGCTVFKCDLCGSNNTVKGEVKFVGLFVNLFLCFRGCVSVGKTNSLSTRAVCNTQQLCEHCLVQGYLLYVGTLCSQNEGGQGCNKILIKGEVESVETIVFDYVVPIVAKCNGKNIVVKREFEINTVNLNGCFVFALGNEDDNFNLDIAFNSCSEIIMVKRVVISVAQEDLFSAQCGKQIYTQTFCNAVQVTQIVTETCTVDYRDCGIVAVGEAIAIFVNGNDGNGVFCSTLNVSLEDNVLCGHYVYILTLGIQPTVKAHNAGVVNHLGDVGAYGQEGGQEGGAVLVYKLYAEEVVYVNGDINAGGSSGVICKENIQNVSYITVELGCNRGCIIAKQTKNLSQSLFKNNLCIKGDVLIKYEFGVAAVEVQQAVVGKLFAVAGSHQTVCKLERLVLYMVVGCAAIFKLVYKSGVEVCERIIGCSSILKEAVQIEVIAESVCELINNIEYGVVEVAVDLCGQMIGDLDAGNAFELFYKYFKGGNFSDCIDQVLCINIVGKLNAGCFFNVCEKNLGIAGSENLVVYLAKQGRINCIQNSYYFFKGQAFCKRDEIIGRCLAGCEDLILECVEFGIVGISHLFESDAQNARELGRNGDICNQLAVYKLNGADLIHQSGKLSSCCTDGIDTCGENKAEVVSLGVFNTLFVEIGESKACFKELAAIVDACQLIQSGNEVFDCIDQLCRQEFDEAAFILFGNNNTVDLDLGDGLLESCKNVECLNKVFVKVKHANQILNHAGLVNDLDQLHNVYLGDNGCGADCLNNAYNVNDIGNGAILNHLGSNGFNTNDIKDCVKVGYVINNSCKAAGDCIDRSTYTDCLNSSGVILEASNELVCGEDLSVKSCGDLALDNFELNKVVIAVLGSKCIYVDNLSGDQLVKLDNISVQELLYVQYVCSDKSCKIGEQRIKCIITKQKNLNIKRCGDVAITGEQLVVQAFKFTGSNQSIHINRVTVYIRKNDIHRKNTVVNCLSDDGFCVGSIHVIGKLILNTTKQTGELGLVNVCGNGCRETVNVCIYVNIQCGLIHVSGCKNRIADLFFDVSQVCSSLNVNTVKLNSRVDLNDFKELCGGKAQCKIHQLAGVIIDKLSCIDVSNCLFEILVIDVAHQKVNILDVFLQINSLEKIYKACFVYASKQSIRIKTFEQRFCVDVSNDRLCKVDQLLLGNDRKELLLGHNTAKTACCGDALEQSHQVAVLEIR